MGAAPNEPTGLLSNPPSNVKQFYKTRAVDGNLPGALALFQGKGTLQSLLRVAAPSAYSSTDEIDHWAYELERAVDRLRDSVIDPYEGFNALYLFDTFEVAYQGRNVRPILSRLGALIVERIVKPAFPDLSEPIETKREGRLRVGYATAHMRNNNGSVWALGWLEAHATDIETFAFNLSDDHDEVTAEWKRLADHYYKLSGPVPEAARLIKSLDLDVLIFTDLGMNGTNTQFAAMRLAPVQCTAWGHPVTSGLPTIDYYLSSDLMEPEDADSHYREKLVRLPNSGLRFRRPRYPDLPASRAQIGLPEGYLPIMCQNAMKCLPEWDEIYLKINEATGKPIFFVPHTKHKVNEITINRLDKLGVKSNWFQRLDPNNFMRVLSLCDVSLDTPAWSGGNTTVQALTMGVPVVTLPGEFMRGRHSKAFLELAGAQGLIAKSADEYVRIATDTGLMREVMSKANADALYEDDAPVRALDDFFWKAARGGDRPEGGVSRLPATQQEPSGLLLEPPPDVRSFYDKKILAGDTASALPELRGTDSLRRLLRFVVPTVYRNEAEIDEWEARAWSALRDLQESPLDAAEAFRGMHLLDTFSLAYQGRNVASILSALGDVFVNQIVRPLFPTLSEPVPRRTEGKLKVGYISTQLGHGNSSQWALGWLEKHRPDIEKYAFNITPHKKAASESWHKFTDHFVELPGSVPESARFIKEAGLDALIYTEIGMSGRNMQFASMRLAPVQFAAWGHPSTNGIPTIDHFISSDWMEPENGQDHYRENLVRLPHSGQRFRRYPLASPGTRSAFGLPEGFLPVMCQNLMKCIPKWDWLFKAVNEATGSPIVFIESRERFTTEITKERLESAGVRAHWLPWLSLDDFFRVVGCCDVSLDPPAWSGGTTTLQALDLGVPVVTLPGEFMRGRLSYAILRAAQAEPLIATSPEEYVRLASDKDGLKQAMASARVAEAFWDDAPVAALDEFLWHECRGG